MRQKKQSTPPVHIRWAPRPGNGWGPIVHLIELAARLFPAEVHTIPNKRGSYWTQFKRRFRSPSNSGEDILFYILHGPKELQIAHSDARFDAPAAKRVAFIVDSFWTNVANKTLMKDFDLIIFMQAYDAEFYEKCKPGKTLHLPWGSDALSLGSLQANRSHDVLRMGRQPSVWDDDAVTANVAARHGLKFQGRPPKDISFPELMSFYADSRYVVAFSNLAAPSSYTHPTKAYFTGRWTDALASGASIAGIAPNEDKGVADVLWPGALLEFDDIDLEANLLRLRKATEDWTPDIARRNHLGALRHLDWRWRLQSLTESLGFESQDLLHELENLNDRIVQIEALG